MGADDGGARRPRWWLLGGCALLLVAGLGVRLHDLDHSALTFHPTRQLTSAVVARALYLDRTRPADDVQRVSADAARQHFGQLETPLNERLVSLLYQAVGHESLWVAGLWEIALWLGGGILLVLVAGRFVDTVGQLAALAVYLFTPLAVPASRSFQPDPLMVVSVVATIWAVLRLRERPTVPRLLWAGGFAGLAVLGKPLALPVVLAAYGLVTLQDRGLRRTLVDPMTWGFAALAVGPMTLATVLGLSVRADAEDYFIGHLLTTWAFYRNWWRLVDSGMGAVIVVVGLAGLVVARGRALALLAGLLVGYLLGGLAFDYRTATHSYYHLVLVPILALGTGVAVDAGARWLQGREFRVARVLLWPALGVALVALLAMSWLALPVLPPGVDPVRDVRSAAAVVGPGAKVLGVTDTYGRELAYFGDMNVIDELPGPGDLSLLTLQGKDLPKLDALIEDSNADWVVITSASKALSVLPVVLWLQEHYHLAGSGPGWTVFDLRRPA